MQKKMVQVVELIQSVSGIKKNGHDKDITVHIAVKQQGKSSSRFGLNQQYVEHMGE